MLACWSLSRRLEQTAALVARSGDLAGAVGAATAALQDSAARARFVARTVALEPAAGASEPEPSQAARGGTAASSGRAGELGDYWRAEADATRQLDSLRALSLEPGLEWLARPLAGLRDALLVRMAAADDAMRHPGARDAVTSSSGQIPARTPDDATAKPADSVAEPDEGAGASPVGSAGRFGDRVDVLAGRLRDAAEDHRREVVAVPLAQAALDRRRLVSAALIGAVLSPVLMLAAKRLGSYQRTSGARGEASKVEALPQTPPKARLWKPLLSKAGPGGASPLAGLGRAQPCFLTGRGTRPLASAPPARPGGSLAPTPGPAPSCPKVAEKPLPGIIPDAPPASQPAGTTPPLGILLVEDNAMVRLSMEMMLAELGHRVSAAADAAEAMRLAEANPDVLVTDLGLPDLDGLTLARQLRARNPRLRVVIASGRPGFAPGAVWLQKPFGLDGLRQAVEASETPGA